jgi:hypothetical protein
MSNVAFETLKLHENHLNLLQERIDENTAEIKQKQGELEAVNAIVAHLPHGTSSLSFSHPGIVDHIKTLRNHWSGFPFTAETDNLDSRAKADTFRTLLINRADILGRELEFLTTTLNQKYQAMGPSVRSAMTILRTQEKLTQRAVDNQNAGR